MQLWVKALLSVLCAAASALFSGLILGYMSLDILQLQLLIYVDAAGPQDRVNSRRARRILPLRREPNLLLSTLIFSNAMVNALMVLLLGDMLDMTWGFVVSTLVTALFGEIAPQSIFMKHALPLCGLFAAPLRVLVILLYPLCKPLALLLDCLLGPCSQVIYNRQQLKALVDMQLEKGNVLTPDEAKMLKGCLELYSVVAESIMTPLDAVYHIEDGTTVTKSVMHSIVKSGFSNIPIVATEGHRCVVGFLVVKDLLMLDAAKSYAVRDLFESIGRPTYAVDAEDKINDIIPYFKGDSNHIVVVRKAFVEPHSGGDPVYKHVGIITIDDVLEVIIQDTMRGDGERGLGWDELALRRKQTQVQKYNRLNSVMSPHKFGLNSILATSKLTDPAPVLTALGVTNCKENVDILKNRQVFRLKTNTLIPGGGVLVLLKGTVGYVDDESTHTPQKHMPYVIHCQELERSVVTRTECEIIEVAVNEGFKV